MIRNQWTICLSDQGRVPVNQYGGGYELNTLLWIEEFSDCPYFKEKNSESDCLEKVNMFNYNYYHKSVLSHPKAFPVRNTDSFMAT